MHEAGLVVLITRTLGLIGFFQNVNGLLLF